MSTTFADHGIMLPPGARGEVPTTCPQCSHKRKKSTAKCLTVNVEKGVWKCHHAHCGWSGALSTTDWRSPSPKPMYAPPRPLPAVSTPTMWDNVVKWFAERGIPESVLAEKGVTAATEYCGQCERDMSRILFPYYVNGQHVNTKHRCGKKHFSMETGAQRVFYNQDGLDPDTTELMIVEGEIDALSAHVAGFRNVVSVPDGAPDPKAKSYASKFAFLEAAEALIERMTRVILATDSDEPGQKLMSELARRIGPEKCSRVIWPVLTV